MSADGAEAIFGARFGRRLIRVSDGSAGDLLRGGLDRVDDAFYAVGTLWRRGDRDGEEGWFVGPGAAGPRPELPPDASPRFSADGARVAYYRGTGGSGTSVFVGPVGLPVRRTLPNRVRADAP